MKIQPGGLDFYKNQVQAVKNTDTSASKAKAAANSGAVVTDTVVISQDAAARAEAGRVAAPLAQEVESTVTPERLQTLQQSVADGSYYVESGAIADAILDRIV